MRAAFHGCVALAAALAACASPAPREVKVAGADTLVNEESGLLAAPADLAVDAAGRLYVSDQILGHVLVVAGAPRVMGRPGAGPGEFQAPEALGVGGDTLWVEDRGNGRMQVLTASGTYVRSHPLPPTAGRTSIDGRGRIAAATLGLSAGRLALLVDGGGHLRLGFGELAAPPAAGWDMEAMKRDVRRGNVPATLRNNAQPVLGRNGDAWLLMQADGEVRRYDAQGKLAWSRRLRSPETRRIRDLFFATNRDDERPFAFFPLSYVSDAVPVGDDLWVLLNLPDEEPSVILVVGATGDVVKRMVLADIHGARSLAVDQARGKLYLAVPSRASVLATPLLDGV